MKVRQVVLCGHNKKLFSEKVKGIVAQFGTITFLSPPHDPKAAVKLTLWEPLAPLTKILPLAETPPVSVTHFVL